MNSNEQAKNSTLASACRRTSAWRSGGLLHARMCTKSVLQPKIKRAGAHTHTHTRTRIRTHARTLHNYMRLTHATTKYAYGYRTNIVIYIRLLGENRKRPAAAQPGILEVVPQMGIWTLSPWKASNDREIERRWTKGGRCHIKEDPRLNPGPLGEKGTGSLFQLFTRQW